MLALVSWAKGQKTTGKEGEEAKAEVLKVEDEFSNAIVTSNWDALPHIFADGMSWIARGDRLDKAQVIADYRSGNLHFRSLTHDHIQVHVFGNTAVITGHSTSILEYKGKLWSQPRLFTSVYVKLGGQWRLVAHQVSEVAK
jgi:ketosteroid isomerase-like protein